MYKEKVIILEAKAQAGVYEGNEYYSLKARSSDIAQNQILEYKVDLKQVNVSDVVALLDKESIITLDLFSSQGKAIIKITAVEKA